MYNKLQHTTNIPYSPTILVQDLQRTFYKCRKWQLEQTLDPINCPYHYYCNSHYPGNYPSWVDTLVIFITAFSFLAATIAMIAAVVGGSRLPEPPWLTKFNRFRRYFLPSGPILLPIIVVFIAKGSRVNTLLSLAVTGPAILQLVRVSALSFETKTESDIKYVSLEVSTMSGILQAALYLDSIILPYYTGLDALESSRFSGECLSCICREEALIVGGTVVYRGWSVTTAMVVGTLTLRMFTRLAPETKGKTMPIKIAIESLSWILMIVE
ncbi:hypothetical protein KSS87_021697, partial [Heliosperma pusillum]